MLGVLHLEGPVQDLLTALFTIVRLQQRLFNTAQSGACGNGGRKEMFDSANQFSTSNGTRYVKETKALKVYFTTSKIARRTIYIGQKNNIDGIPTVSAITYKPCLRQKLLIQDKGT